MEKSPYYLGVDLCDQYAMISSFHLNINNEPDTVSTVAGGDQYEIPLVLAKRRGLGQWYFGEEALRMAKTREMTCVDHLYNRAVAGECIRIEEESYQASELLFLFLEKLLQLPQKLGGPQEFDRLVITVERLDRQIMELFWSFADELSLTREQFAVIDHKESFYYYTLSQQEELWLHDVFLFDASQGFVSYYALSRDMRTTPQLVTIGEEERLALGMNRDAEFKKLLTDRFDGRVVSTVFLVGDGFEGDWMQDSLNFLCRGRRVFMGSNLFSKGACYAAAVKEKQVPWNYIYMGEHEMKFNLSIKVRRQGELQFFTLVSAGENWFETGSSCEVILSGETQINFWKQLPKSREAKIETLELNDIPNRPDRTTRLRITAEPVSDDKIEITIEDLGFGEFFRSSEKSWKYTMSV